MVIKQIIHGYHVIIVFILVFTQKIMSISLLIAIRYYEWIWKL